MARRGDEAEAEALEIVERVVERMDLQLAAIAGAGIDLADRQAAAEPAACGRIETSRQRRQIRILACRRRLGERRAKKTLKEQLAHGDGP
jgi:hypothetical protein